jgi:hypothetical protein
VIDSLVGLWKKEIEEDPLTLLDPLLSSSEGGEFKVLKSFARDTGLYVATLTGSMIYTDSDTQWARFHETDGVNRYKPDPAAAEAVRCLDSRHIEAPTDTYHHPVDPPGACETRALLRHVAVALRAGIAFDVAGQSTAGSTYPLEEDGPPTYRLRSSVPLNGFQRTDVSRLVLTFGRLEDVAPVRLGLFLEPIPQPRQMHESSRPVAGSAASEPP